MNKDVLISLFVTSLLFLFVGGLCMAFGTGNAWWLLLTAGVLIIFYAG